MQSTTKLYDLDAYAVSFSASVLQCEEIKNGFAIILDKTLFFPEEGGQSPDKGTLNGQTVTDVQISKGIITHVMDVPLKAGTLVNGRIDWAHRFSNMQQHTGEHIFSGLTHKHFGYDNVGFHLSDQIVTMDFNGKLTDTDIQMLEAEANQAIWENVPVSADYPSKEDLHNLDYRSKIAIDGPIRIVTVEGYDVCACCAPHVHHTGEIGLLKIIDFRRYKGGMRLNLLCGRRALADYRMRQTQTQQISTFLSVPWEEIAQATEKLKMNLDQTKISLFDARKTVILQKITSFPVDQADIFLFEEGLDSSTMRAAVNAMTETHSGYCGIFCGNDQSGYQFIIGSTTKNCQDFATTLKNRFSAKGGGKPVMIQGSVSASATDLTEMINA